MNQTATALHPFVEDLLLDLELFITDLGEPGMPPQLAWKVSSARATLAVLRAELEELEVS
jgi:hypothetical protein